MHRIDNTHWAGFSLGALIPSLQLITRIRRTKDRNQPTVMLGCESYSGLSDELVGMLVGKFSPAIIR